MCVNPCCNFVPVWQVGHHQRSWGGGNEPQNKTARGGKWLRYLGASFGTALCVGTTAIQGPFKRVKKDKNCQKVRTAPEDPNSKPKSWGCSTDPRGSGGLSHQQKLPWFARLFRLPISAGSGPELGPNWCVCSECRCLSYSFALRPRMTIQYSESCQTEQYGLNPNGVSPCLVAFFEIPILLCMV